MFPTSLDVALRLDCRAQLHFRNLLAMAKRVQQHENQKPGDKKTKTANAAESAAKRVSDNVDAMGCIIQAVIREGQERAKEAADAISFLHRRIENLEAQCSHLFRENNRLSLTCADLADRFDLLDTALIRVGSTGQDERDALFNAIEEIRPDNQFQMDDLDRILETCDEELGLPTMSEFGDMFSDIDEYFGN